MANRRDPRFRAMYEALPQSVRRRAILAFQQFRRNPAHPGLRVHQLRNTSGGSHSPNSVSVSFGSGYRAIYRVDGSDNVWYWIGSHADYDTFTGR